MLNPAGGEVRVVLGARVPGGPLDNGAWHFGVDAAGAPSRATLVPIEAKNLRQWIYPRTQELYQLLDKAVTLQLDHPDRWMVPVFVCRWAQDPLGSMARQIGFHLITTRNQYIRPLILNDADNARKLEEINREFEYRLVPHDEAVPAMVKQFRQYLPARIDEAAERWAAFAAHPDVPDLVAALRDDEISNQERAEFKDELGRCVREVTGEDVLWAADEADHET
ncbi:hypothetical protein [Agromyces larvae]|uniref:Uncharacterized protein n=1 Tax=Agromyces larvae TaxID=2929802 RepID=A0ABY4BVH5_9MICO|nr:hypothetical protein [Agromyces larvae]UOE43170.1 hypothetical protein MTO99_13360 [Agromyces larvae]